jgi:Ser/Thr protein kinase RdoA (MazF antagonist)
MITGPPFDPSLPAIAAMLDERSVLAILSPPIREMLTGCTPRYIRYKPGTSCLFQYDFAFATGETESAQIRIFEDDRAERRASRSRLKHLQARASDKHPQVDRVAYLPAVNGLLQIFPVDYDLGSLATAADEGRMTKIMRASLGAGDDFAVTVEPEVIRYKPARKAILRYRLRNGPVDTIYGKVNSSDDGESLAGWTSALIDGGVPTPPVLLTVPEHLFVAHPEVPGVQLASLRGQPEYVDWMAPLVETLGLLQSADAGRMTVYRLANLAKELARTSRWLSIVASRLESRFARLNERIARSLSAMDDRLVIAHGDFYDDQVVVSVPGDELTLIDLDELRLGHPLLDAGNMLAHLSSGNALGDDAAEAYNAFRHEILDGKMGSESDLAVFEAAALFKLAPGPFRRLEPNWPAGIEQILDLAENLLEPRNAVRPAIADPALPHLGTLQDPARMTDRVAEMLGAPSVTLTGVDLVRHKPGRRAILRYRLDDGERLYGKTFASARGPKVYEITRRITSANAFGPDVALPRPVGFLPDFNMLLQREVEGEPVAQSLLAGDRDLGIRIAFALYQFHTSGLKLGRTHDLAKELSPLRTRRDEVAETCPELRALAGGCLRRIEAVDSSNFAWRERPVHRDFYHEQVMIGREGLAILDLDDAAMSEPAVDVANFVAHLMLLGAQRRRDVSALANVSDGFIGQYCQLDTELDPQLLTYLTATTLLRLAGIHVSRENGPAVARMVLESSAGLLDPISA